jgi:hypothetical protein
MTAAKALKALVRKVDMGAPSLVVLTFLDPSVAPDDVAPLTAPMRGMTADICASAARTKRDDRGTE